MFSDLPLSYQHAINAAIKDVQGAEDSEIAESFKEYTAEWLLGCQLSDGDTIDVDEFGDDLCAFRGGWNAFYKYYIYPVVRSS